jgi:hypothetical protein
MVGQTNINTCIVSELNNLCKNKEDNINKSEALNGRTNEHQHLYSVKTEKISA